MSQAPPLACDLGALTAAERTRRKTLAARVAGVFREIQETWGPGVRELLTAAGFKARPRPQR